LLGPAFVATSGAVGFVANRAMTAPAKISVLALDIRSIEVKRFRLNAGAVFILIGFELRINDLSREDYTIVINRSKLFLWLLVLSLLILESLDSGEGLTAIC
jgi:hypothetical protein